MVMKKKLIGALRGGQRRRTSRCSDVWHPPRGDSAARNPSWRGWAYQGWWRTL